MSSSTDPKLEALMDEYTGLLVRTNARVAQVLWRMEDGTDDGD